MQPESDTPPNEHAYQILRSGVCGLRALQQFVYGRRDLLRVVLGHEVLASLDALNRCPKLVGSR